MNKTAETKLEDAFGAARSYLHAIRLAAAGMKNERDVCAFDLLAESVERELNRAQAITDTMMEERHAE